MRHFAVHRFPPEAAVHKDRAAAAGAEADRSRTAAAARADIAAARERAAELGDYIQPTRESVWAWAAARHIHSPAEEAEAAALRAEDVPHAGGKRRDRVRYSYSFQSPSYLVVLSYLFIDAEARASVTLPYV